MGFADFSVADVYSGIIAKLNTQLTAGGKLFKNQTTGDFADQTRYNSALKRLEYWTGSVWAALDMTGTNPSRGALVYNNPIVTSGVPIAFASEDYDSDNIHEAVTHPDRLTVPAGVTRVQLIFSVQSWGSLAVGSENANLYKNGNSVYIGKAGLYVMDANTAMVYHPIVSPELRVQGGDYFNVVPVGASSVGADATGVYNWFAMKIIQ